MATEQQRKTFDPVEMMQLYAGISRKSGELMTRSVRKMRGACVRPPQPFQDELGIRSAFS